VSDDPIVSIPRGERGELQIALCRTVQGQPFVELRHVSPDGEVGRGSTLKISEIGAVVAALRAIAVREQQKRPRPAIQQSLPESGPSEQTRREMALF